MKKIFYLLSSVYLLAAVACNQPATDKEASGADQEAEKAAVDKRVNDLTEAIRSGSLDSLNELTYDAVIYRHSNGDVQTKRGFVDSLATKAWRFTQINTTDQKVIAVDNDVAVVKQKIFGEHVKNVQPPGKVALDVLMVWKKIDGKWVLAIRDATKLLPPNDVPPAE